ncbi:MAG: hypothetical protein P8M04_08250 [Akkermansiaceae bacterium]|nr:hypothetical protein [Akkermansiaceae bacterium]
MKNFLLLLFAFAIVVVFGGTAFFFWENSKGARFERLDKSSQEISAESSQQEQSSTRQAPAPERRFPK